MKCSERLVDRIKATPRRSEVSEIRIPGERAFRSRARALREGIEIDRARSISSPNCCLNWSRSASSSGLNTTNKYRRPDRRRVPSR